jgi:hypothetical protein
MLSHFDADTQKLCGIIAVLSVILIGGFTYQIMLV